MSDRKKDHINLALESQTGKEIRDTRFDYEPMLASHPTKGLLPFNFLGKTFRAPMWVSSMTGGTELAGTINQNLARVCKEFGFGMGLGSCRVLLNSDASLNDFNVRDLIGDDLPLYANLGICQIEKLIENNQVGKIMDLRDRLRADGLIIHVNPLQEWMQPEGNTLKYPPIETIKQLIDKVNFPVIVKEVGQGMGPASLGELLSLPLEAIEFAAFGGTNFAKIEMLRNSTDRMNLYEPLTKVGHDASQMIDSVNQICSSEKSILCKQIIISGGVTDFLTGYYLIKKSKLPAVFGQASALLAHARENYEHLQRFVSGQIRGLEMAYAYLRIKT